MKKMVDCPNWKEYHSLNGWVMFCSAGAYGKILSAAEAAGCGCTAEQKSKCKKIMENNVGFGLVPETKADPGTTEWAGKPGREPAILPGR